MNKFLKDLEKELKKLKISEKDIKEILEDHEEMMEAAKNEGLDEKEMENKFGNPQKIAKDIKNDMNAPQEKKDYVFENVDSCVKINTAGYNLVKAFPVVSDSISIDISMVSEDLEYTTYEGESIQVFEKDVKNIDEYTISLENNVFTLIRNKSKIKIFNFSRDNGSFIVLVPENLKIGSFDYKTVSGDAEMNMINSEECKFKTTSGDVEISNLETGKLKISSVSGDLEMARLKAKSFDISLVSGDLEMEKVVIDEDMYINTVSGDVELKEVECAVCTFKTVSGDMEGKEFYPNEISLKSISGDISIVNMDKLKEVIVTSKKTISGDIEIS